MSNKFRINGSLNTENLIVEDLLNVKNLVVKNNLQVKGSTQTVNQETLTIKDNLIAVNGDGTNLEAIGKAGFVIDSGEKDFVLEGNYVLDLNYIKEQIKIEKKDVKIEYTLNSYLFKEKINAKFDSYGNLFSYNENFISKFNNLKLPADLFFGFSMHLYIEIDTSMDENHKIALWAIQGENIDLNSYNILIISSSGLTTNPNYINSLRIYTTNQELGDIQQVLEKQSETPIVEVEDTFIKYFNSLPLPFRFNYNYDNKLPIMLNTSLGYPVLYIYLDETRYFDNDIFTSDNIIISNNDANALTYILKKPGGSNLTMFDYGSRNRAYAAPVYDQASKSLKIGMGSYNKDKNGNITSFEFDKEQGQSLATRSGTFNTNNILMWDGSKNTIVDSDISVEQLMSMGGTQLYKHIAIINRTEIEGGFTYQKIEFVSTRNTTFSYIGEALDDIYNNPFTSLARGYWVEEITNDYIGYGQTYYDFFVSGKGDWVCLVTLATDDNIRVKYLRDLMVFGDIIEEYAPIAL